MSRMHFFESLERENDYQKEYEKLEIMCNQIVSGPTPYSKTSINIWIDKNFLYWKRRSNYVSFDELREQLGFRVIRSFQNVQIINDSIGLNEYLLFCEMLRNLAFDLKGYWDSVLNEQFNAINMTIDATLQKAGMEIRNVDGEIKIVEKNAVAIEVAETFPELSDAVIEYNHYLLRGNINKKKYLLKAIADVLEPKKSQLSGSYKSITDDFFMLVNNMNIRHNNCDPGDPKKYNAKFDKMSPKEKEQCYDIIYEQGLTLFVLLGQMERNKIIEKYKKRE